MQAALPQRERVDVQRDSDEVATQPGDHGAPTCRYLAVRYHLIAAFLARGNELDEERATAFLPYRDPTKRYKAGRPPTGWFGQLVRRGDLDAAG